MRLLSENKIFFWTATLGWILFGVAGALWFAAFLGGNFFANYAWVNYRLGSAAVALDRSDVGLAMEIGNYYFNGGAYDLNTAERAYKKAVAVDSMVFGDH